MREDLLAPTTTFDHQVCSCFPETIHGIVEGNIGKVVEVSVNLCSNRDLPDCVMFELIVGLSASILDLILKAEVKVLVQQNLNQFTLSLLIYILIILMSEFVKVVTGLLQDFGALRSKTFNELFLRFFLQLLGLGCNKLHRFVLKLPAAETGNHHSLVRKVQLFLRADLLPGVSNEEGQAVHGHVFSFPWGGEKRVSI